jgi:hypothetical protein
MKKEFCSYEQSLALKELEFNEICLAYYNELKEIHNLNGTTNALLKDMYGKDNFIAPLIQQAFRFFRKTFGCVHNIELGFDYNHDNRTAEYDASINTSYEMYTVGCFKTYEEAEQACLDKLIELAKESKQ